MDDRKMYSTQEVASLIGISDARIRQLLAKGRAEATKIAGVWLFTGAQVEQLRNRQKGKGGRRRK